MSNRVPKVKLNDGNEIPIIGLGTYLAEKGICYQAVKDAIDIGYRHFDCALIYGNQDEIGQALNEAISQNKVTREELFVTSKIWPTYYDHGRLMECAKRILHEFKLDYVDLMLLHWPIPFVSNNNEFYPKDSNDEVMVLDIDLVDVYKQLEQVKKMGLSKSIGVSNFNSEQIERICNKAEIIPVINQVESHPYLSQEKLIQFCEAKGIKLTAYRPLGGASKPDQPNLLDDEIVNKIAKKYDKTPANILIKWHVQRGVIVIPKSVNKERMKNNFDVFSYELSDDDMKQLNLLDKGLRFIDYTKFGLGKSKEWPFRIPF